MQLNTSKSYTYLIMLLDKKIPPAVFCDITTPQDEYTNLMECIKALIQQEKEITALNLASHAFAKGDDVGKLVEMLNDLDDRNLVKRLVSPENPGTV